MLTNSLILSQSSSSGSAMGGMGGMIILVIWIAIIVLSFAGMWKVFDKAGQPGWAAIIPIYNLIVLLKVAGKPLWWIILFLIPIINIIPSILIPIAVAKNFGKGIGTGIGIIFLPFIFYPILGFGSAEYNPKP